MRDAMSEQMPEIEAPEHPQHLLAPPGQGPSNVTVVEKRVSRRGWVYAVVIVLLALGAFFWYRQGHSSAATQKAGGKGGKGGAAGAIPVVAVAATMGNIGVYVTGLGAITPIYTVTVK